MSKTTHAPVSLFVDLIKSSPPEAGSGGREGGIEDKVLLPEKSR